MTRVGIYSIVLILAFGSISMAARWAVSVEKGNIRSGPGPEFDVIWQVEKYYPVDVIDRKGDWRYFRDLDGDEDIDVRDLDRFLNCMSGANVPGDPNCND